MATMTPQSEAPAAVAEESRPNKRQKTSPTNNTLEASQDLIQGKAVTHAAETEESLNDETLKERAAGIKAFVSPSTSESDAAVALDGSFRGVLKKRYTDFLVNEILLDGKVLRLQNLKSSPGILQGKDQFSGSVETEQGGHQVSEKSLSIAEPVQSSSQDGKSIAESGSPKANTFTVSTSEDKAAADTSDEVSTENVSLLESYLGESTTSELVSLYHRSKARESAKGRPRNHLGTVQANDVIDRATRTKVHEAVRSIFSSRIISSTDKDGLLSFSAAANAKSNPKEATYRNSQQQRPKLSWSERGGSFLHFSIYKENKDTMEVISYLARQLHINPKGFAFAGTKDKRAVTVQRASVYRCEAERLAGINRTLRASAVGDFKYEPQGLSLGDLDGNEFCVTLRDCLFEGESKSSPRQNALAKRQKQAQIAMTKGMTDLRERGFLNYYGLQRFGTFAARTDAVGVKLLQGDFQGAVDVILDYNPDALNEADSGGKDDAPDRMISTDDRARASAINLFRSTGSSHQALERLPRKFSAESNIIRHLAKSPNDLAGALQTIPRNLRLMYVHAYQSLVWNNAASARWSAFDSQVREGDLVLVHEHRDKELAAIAAPETADADGEAVVLPAAEDSAVTADEAFERARALTAVEAESGLYSVFDVVLPLPGFDVLYPANELKNWYQEFMGSEEGGKLDPLDMRRKQKDFSLSGSYRKVMARIGEGWSAEVKVYGEKGEDEQFVETDLERIRKAEKEKRGEREGSAPRTEQENVPMGDKLAVILKFRLGASQYATMALRELSKGGIVPHKGDYSGGR